MDIELFQNTISISIVAYFKWRTSKLIGINDNINELNQSPYQGTLEARGEIVATAHDQQTLLFVEILGDFKNLFVQ